MNISSILDQLDTFGVIHISRQVGNWYQIYCPFHSDGQERKPSCGVLLEDEYRNGRLYPMGFFHCFTCGYAQQLAIAIHDILKLRPVSAAVADWIAVNVPGFLPSGELDFDYLVPPELSASLINAWEISGDVAKKLGPTYPYVTEDELIRYRYIVPYMYERGMTDELIEMFDVGYDGEWKAPGRRNVTPCITFPVRDRQGRTLFIYRRAIATKFFHMPTGLTKPCYGIYELHKYVPEVRSVIITESIIDAITCWRFGKPAVALMSTGNTYQIDQLRRLGVYEYVLGFDNDEAGMRATAKWKKNLKDVAIVWALQLPDDKKDINELTQDEFNLAFTLKR